MLLFLFMAYRSDRKRLGFQLDSLRKQLARTRAQDIRQWIVDLVGLTQWHNVAILIHGVSLRSETPRLPARQPAQAAGAHQSARYSSVDRRSRRADAVAQCCYSYSWRIAQIGNASASNSAACASSWRAPERKIFVSGPSSCSA